MDENEFWQLMEGLDPADRNGDLKRRLSSLEPENIVEFGRAFQLAAARAYDWALFGAFKLIHGGTCSEELFDASCFGLVSRGRKAYEDALGNPDTIAEWLKVEDQIEGQDGTDTALEIYEAKTGLEFPVLEYPHMNPTGDEDLVEFDDGWPKAFPRLYARFGAVAKA
ncbi:MAG: DUF4240 domain-containing protein [Chthoniobacterales bacterium]|nr:DUF4240 domain-containing protein [Chthoniobacterales bacterium]